VQDIIASLKKTVEQGQWGYHANGPRSTEPAAWACLALGAHGLLEVALPLAEWLVVVQHPRGSVGVTQEQDMPAWPTSLALLAWQTCDRATGSTTFEIQQQQALAWTLKTKGSTLPQADHIGHDTTTPGWSWAADTHSWMEPTCMFVLALKAVGQSKHSRTRQGVHVITDRQLKSGGCNFGSTTVLGQPTLPQMEATGLAMLALADEANIEANIEANTDPRIERSLRYLEQELDEEKEIATASLCYALLGLTAHHRRPLRAEALLQHAYARELERGTSCYKLALLTLASLQDSSWLPHFAPSHTASLTS